MRLIIGISGASGVIYAIRLLNILKNQKDIEIHLIVSDAAKKILQEETNTSVTQLSTEVEKYYSEHDFEASLNSGSFITDGMIVVPCSLKTLAAIALGLSNNLIARAAEVTIKEGRKLVLVPRETPLSLTSLQNMCRAAENGAVILPGMPAFYHKPRTKEELIDYIVGKILDQFSISHNLFTRWREKEK